MAHQINLTNKELGQYRVMELLGEGGMGTVYRATQGRLRRDVAVKVLPSSLSSNEGLRERFMREAQTAANLEHPNIVTIYDYGNQDNLSYVVMQFLKGGALEERIEALKIGKLATPSLHEVSEFLNKVASALDYAHSRGVIHRDIKPGNVMFNDKGNPYIVDFGIAKLLNATSNLTGTGIAVGTPVYMSPEQWRGFDITPAADQYALGGLMYHLLTGKPPFDAPNQFALMTKHLTEMPLPPDAVNPSIPAGISDVLARTLAKEPVDRFPRMKDFAKAFERVALSFPGEKSNFFTEPLPDMTAIMAAKKPSPDDPLNTNPAKKLDSVVDHDWISDSESQEVRHQRRNVQNWALTAVVTILLLMVGVIIFLGLNSETTESGTEEAAIDGANGDAAGVDPFNDLERANLPDHELTVASNTEWEINIVEQQGVDMAQVPPGCFLSSANLDAFQAQMLDCEASGSAFCDPDIIKQSFWTCIEQPYYIDKYEISNEVFDQFGGVATTPSAWTDDSQPRTAITRDEAQAMCALRGGRLASDAEWEYAARGPDELLYPWGNTFSADFIVEQDNGEACNVRCRSNGKSWVGAMNLSGNVAEWVASNSDTPDELVVRGGAWVDDDVEGLTQMATSRVVLDAESDLTNVGFRCAMTDLEGGDEPIVEAGDSEPSDEAGDEVVAAVDETDDSQTTDTVDVEVDVEGETPADSDTADTVDDSVDTTIVDDEDTNDTTTGEDAVDNSRVPPLKPPKAPKTTSTSTASASSTDTDSASSGSTGGSGGSRGGRPTANDRDGDGITDSQDACPDYANDEFGDPCNPNEDGDQALDNTDECPFQASNEPNGCPAVDTDGDGIPDYRDPCYLDPGNDSYNNPCNHDEDGDGVLDDNDACPASPNDPYNDPCNHDEDGDGVLDVNDACPMTYNDPIGDPCNPNEDGDGFPDVSDVCPFDPFHDPIGNPCNHNEDGDAYPDTVDPFPFDPLLP